MYSPRPRDSFQFLDENLAPPPFYAVMYAVGIGAVLLWLVTALGTEAPVVQRMLFTMTFMLVLLSVVFMYIAAKVKVPSYLVYGVASIALIPLAWAVARNATTPETLPIYTAGPIRFGVCLGLGAFLFRVGHLNFGWHNGKLRWAMFFMLGGFVVFLTGLEAWPSTWAFFPHRMDVFKHPGKYRHYLIHHASDMPIADQAAILMIIYQQQVVQGREDKKLVEAMKASLDQATTKLNQLGH